MLISLSQYVLSSGKDGNAALWELSTGRDMLPYPTHFFLFSPLT